MSQSELWLVMGLMLPWIISVGMVAASVAPSVSQIATKPLSWFILAPQVRKDYDQDELKRLGDSMKSLGQLQPVGATAAGSVLWGHRRILAAKLVGLTTLQVIITDRQMSDSEIRLIQLTENMHRADLSGYEKWLACSELMSMNPTWQMKDLADSIHLDPSMVTRILSPSRCSPEWQAALKDGKVGISDCYAASKLADSEQARLLALKLSGASRDQIEQAGRKSRNKGVPTVKMSRVKIAMPQKATVVISGNELSMSEVVELLSETLKEARKAAEQYDVKTFQAMMRDKAKAGG
jgi:ParB family chromosome partitioning protein